MYQLMGVFCNRLKLGSTAALDCQTGQNKGRYHKKELLFLLVLLYSAIGIKGILHSECKDLQCRHGILSADQLMHAHLWK